MPTPGWTYDDMDLYNQEQESKTMWNLKAQAERREARSHQPPVETEPTYRFGIVYRTDTETKEVFVHASSYDDLRFMWEKLPIAKGVIVVQVYLWKAGHPDGGFFVADHL